MTDFTDSSASAHTVNGDDPQHGSPPMHFAPKFGKGSGSNFFHTVSLNCYK